MADVAATAAGEALVEVTRGGHVESAHLGAIAMVDARGALRWSVGDPRVVTFPRSSLKPLQLLALVERGGVEKFGLLPDEIAVMAGSHGGEPMHVERVLGILEKIGTVPEALACGAQSPLHPAAVTALGASGGTAGAVHNNCSGKHAGMLALARLLGSPLEDYINPDHPAQRAIRETLLDVLRLGPNDIAIGIDGCSAPAYAVPLDRMAMAFGMLGCPQMAAERDRDALATIASAMRGHPELVGASAARLDTSLMQLDRGIIAKSGAEGYFCVGCADGVGLAVKVIDGDPAARARHLAVLMAVRRAGWITDADLAAPLAGFGPRLTITNLAGRTTGEIRPAAALHPHSTD